MRRHLESWRQRLPGWPRLLGMCLGVVVLALLSRGAAHDQARADAPLTGTAVCGSLPPGLTTWTAAGAPYHLCAAGVTVPTGSVLTLGGTLGGFTVDAVGPGGLTVDGSMLTVGTSANAAISMTSARGTPAASDWGGIAVGDSTTNLPGAVDVSYVHISYANTALQGYDASLHLDHVQITNSGSGLFVTGSTSNSTIVDSTVSNVGGQLAAILGNTIDLTRDTFTQGRDGVDAVGQHVHLEGVTVTDASSSGVHAGSDDLAIHDVDVERITRNEPSVELSGNSIRLGPGGNVTNVTGANNGWDAVGISGRVLGSFVWTSVTQHAVPLPLGYVMTGTTVTGPGSITVPAGGHVVITDRFVLENTVFDASAGGATIDPGPGWTANVDGYESETVFAVSTPNPLSASSFYLSSAKVSGLSFNIQSKAASTVGGVPYAFAALGSTFDHAHIIGMHSAISVTGGSINYGYVFSTDAALTVVGVHITIAFPDYAVSVGAIGSAGIFAWPTHQPVDLENNVVEGFPVGIAVGPSESIPSIYIGDESDHLRVRNNVVRGAGLGSGALGKPYEPYGSAAIWLNHVAVSVGPQGDVFGNTGSNNWYDDVDLTGDVTSDFSWVTATNSTTDHPLGYITGGLRMTGPLTLTLPANAVLKVRTRYQTPGNPPTYPAADGVGDIALDGASLVALPGSTVTYFEDTQTGLSDCYWQPDADRCPQPGHDVVPMPSHWFSGINIHADPTGIVRGHADIDGLTLKYGALRIDSGATATNGQPYGIVAHKLTLDGGELIADHTAVHLDGLFVDQLYPQISPQFDGADPRIGAVTLRDSSGSLIENSAFRDTAAGSGIAVHRADATITRSTFAFFRSVSGFGGGTRSIVAPDARVDVSCISYGPHTWGLQLGGGSTVHDSNLVGGFHPATEVPYTTGGYDVDAEDPYPNVDATGNWWGRAIGPLNEQVTHPENTDTTMPRSKPSDCAPPLLATPDKPTSVKASQGSAASTLPAVTLSWGAPIGTVPITGYRLTLVGPNLTTEVPATTHTWSGRLPPGTWTASVAAEGSGGPGPAVAVTLRVVGEPSAPASLQTDVSGLRATLRWSAPRSDGGAPISEYEVSVNGRLTLVSAATSTYTLTLVPGRRYVVTVRSRNQYGAGPAASNVFIGGVSGTYRRI